MFNTPTEKKLFYNFKKLEILMCITRDHHWWWSIFIYF